MKKLIYLALLLGAVLGTANIQAQVVPQASSSFTPTWIARHSLQWLADQQQLPVLTTQWPLPSSAVAQSLSGLSSEAGDADSAAKLFVQNELALVQDKGNLQHQSRNHAQGLVGFSENYSTGSSASLSSAEWHAGQADGVSFAGRLGIRAESNASSIPNSIVKVQHHSSGTLGGAPERDLKRRLVIGHNCPNFRQCSN